ncbi:MAG: restriction endonuclease [Sulfuricaulis sp.]|uniref:restriction endonuclease n=1 Tax=Sulfuricaulis sp. TaxID=2003553 RepID=UPI0025DE7E0C|nr:restriction endonuclease [Sulfuricaulis sp.]MCR4347514.1 restriction endonuclease [Sulfuricaulis sp.]
MLKVLKVYRYTVTGKLVAALGQGNLVFPLNSDLSFSGKGPHRVNRDTLIEITPYRVEVEIQDAGKDNSYKIVRTWNEDQLPRKVTDPNAPLEKRIDISPSEELSNSEKIYVGQSDGHAISTVLFVFTFFSIFMIGVWGWWPPLVALISGLLVLYFTKTPGDATKIQEVKDAKNRIRDLAEKELRLAMRDVHAWASLDGIGFERAVARIYKDQGFEVEFTPRSNDQDIDLILKKNGKVRIVQCKAHAKNIGVAAIRELAGVRASWPHAEEAILASLFDYSGAAKKFAKEHNIKLFSIARDYLKSDYRPGT